MNLAVQSSLGSFGLVKSLLNLQYLVSTCVILYHNEYHVKLSFFFHPTISSHLSIRSRCLHMFPLCFPICFHNIPLCLHSIPSMVTISVLCCCLLAYTVHILVSYSRSSHGAFKWDTEFKHLLHSIRFPQSLPLSSTLILPLSH